MMAFPTSNSVNKSAEDKEDDVVVCGDEAEDVNVDGDDRGETPLRYVPLQEVYSATSPFVTVSGSKKVKPPNRKHHLQMVNHLNGHDHLKPNGNNCNNHSLSCPLEKQLHSSMSPPVTRVYTRRRKKMASFYDTMISRSKFENSEGVVVKEEKVEVLETENKLSISENKKEEKKRVGKFVKSLNSESKKDDEFEEEIEDGKLILKEKKKKGKSTKGKIVISVKSELEENEDESQGDGKVIAFKKKSHKRMSVDANSENNESKEEEKSVEEHRKSKKRKSAAYELVNLGLDSDSLKDLSGPRVRQPRSNFFKSSKLGENSNGKISNKKRKSGDDAGNQTELKNSGSLRTKRWVWLRFDGVDPRKFIGLQCKVYWPLDADWYSGRIIDYNAESGRHKVEYEDRDQEHLILGNERLKFYISPEEMQCLNLSCSNRSLDADGPDVNELVVLAASLDDSQEFEPGDIIWAKLTGHAMWPAIVLDESLGGECKGLKKALGETSILVQFFGTHDFARVKRKQVIPFLRGLLSSLHQKCKKSNFVQSLEEAKMYLSELRIPRRMLCLRSSLDPDNYDSEIGENEGIADLDEEYMGNYGREGRLDGALEITDFKKFSKSELSSKASKLSSFRHQDLPLGYRAVHVKWRDLDRCNVCHMDEEYENNLFLQCAKCRIMVHARCYGELDPVDEEVWLCNLCRPGAPKAPFCCLCPFIGGAMKPTTDGRWAHLACAMWIPETCLSDIMRMEPIDGLSRINKDRWKLLCSICGVSYGACIQCSNHTCRVAFHPLCARAAGFCVELADEDRLHLMSFEEDEEEQCIRLLSFCKRHRPLSKDRAVVNERIAQKACENADYTPPSNPSGCARSEPYNYAGRRGRKEPEAASLKRLYVENMPHLVGGHTQHGLLWNTLSANGFADSKSLVGLRNLRNFHLDASTNILSVAEKYKYMRETFKKRLAFGKSRIHGFGIFSRLPHRAGDMMIEYSGELVRPPVADRREHLIYNSLVGAGTYMFRIDDERVIDATRAGSIAHLINHSCEPNCYSRVISVNGDEHIIIFAKRDIKQWEELSYDYRFFSIDEQLACYCGFPRCRSIVNDTEAEERAGKLHALRSELIDWKGE